MSGLPSTFLPSSFTGSCLSYRAWAKAAGYESDVVTFDPSFLESPIHQHWQGSIDFVKREYHEGLSVTRGKNVTALVHCWAFDNMAKRQPDRYVHLVSSKGDLVARDRVWIDMVVGKCFAREARPEIDGYRFDIEDYPVLARIDEPCFYIGSHRTWGHWICDHLGRFELLDLFPAYKSRRIVLDDLMPIHQDVLDLWDIDRGRVISIKDAPQATFSYLFDDLAVASEPPYSRAIWRSVRWNGSRFPRRRGRRGSICRGPISRPITGLKTSRTFRRCSNPGVSRSFSPIRLRSPRSQGSSRTPRLSSCPAVRAGPI